MATSIPLRTQRAKPPIRRMRLCTNPRYSIHTFVPTYNNVLSQVGSKPTSRIFWIGICCGLWSWRPPGALVVHVLVEQYGFTP